MAPGWTEPVASTVAEDGYAFVHAAEMRDLLTRHGALSDWQAFAASWNHLELDRYMADGGRYRRRRYAVFPATAAGPSGLLVFLLPGPATRDYFDLPHSASNRCCRPQFHL